MFLSERKMEYLPQRNIELAIKHIVEVLERDALREKIENDLIMQKEISETDWEAFYRHCIEKAVVLGECLPAIKKYSKKATDERKQKPEKGSWKDRKGGGGKDEKRRVPVETTVKMWTLLRKKTMLTIRGNRRSILICHPLASTWRRVKGCHIS